MGAFMHRTIMFGVATLLLTAGAVFAGTPINVPEPTSLSILAAGIGVLAVTRYLRGKK